MKKHQRKTLTKITHIHDVLQCYIFGNHEEINKQDFLSDDSIEGDKLKLSINKATDQRTVSFKKYDGLNCIIVILSTNSYDGCLININKPD